MYRLHLYPELFKTQEQIIVQSEKFSVSTKRYPQDIAGLTIRNSRGYVEILPFMGQMIWDAVFDGHSLRMGNMFDKPQRAQEIVDTYGCFAFHSGLLSGGCPAPEDNHPLHGEFPCAAMDCAYLCIDGERIKLVSEYEYVRGFGHHYRLRALRHQYAGRKPLCLSKNAVDLYVPYELRLYRQGRHAAKYSRRRPAIAPQHSGAPASGP